MGLRDVAKREFLEEWVQAVNAHGQFGAWCWDFCFSPAELADLLAEHAGPARAGS